MYCKQMLAILIIAFVDLPSLTRAAEHIVGDNYGWNLNVNYTAWAEGRQFRVGDTLVFKYGVEVHNVFKVSGSTFEQCRVPPENEAMTSGSDVITLATPGKKWYMCGKAEGRHCWAGMRLAIEVLPLPSVEQPPSASPSNSPTWEVPAQAPAPAPSRYPPPTRPRIYFVGDDKGWTLNFDYDAWAKGKEFRVGDVLVFRYSMGAHNVFKVDGPDFKACNAPPEKEALTSGYDEIALATPGRKRYICGVGTHCQMGQKLVINVLPLVSAAPSKAPSAPPACKALAPAPSHPMPPTSRPPTRYIVGDHHGWTLIFNYTAWIEGKEFRVGDTLVFKYVPGNHNVFKVDPHAFQACNAPPEEESLTSGHDAITLASPGKKWYICGKAHGKHCRMGMKLFINVLPQCPPSGHRRRLFM